MSATMEARPITEFLGQPQKPCNVIELQVPTFPVTVEFLRSHDERSIDEQAAEKVADIIREEEGDILIFMPGMGEILRTIEAIRHARVGERLALLPLHGELSPEEQDAAFAPNDMRKVVVSTNVAETSVTIDGIRHVIDSGLARVHRYDPERGLNMLHLEKISRASADQRKGRAGRTAPGTCHRLWTESDHLNRSAFLTPELQRSDLAETVLLLHSLDIPNARQFPWLNPPHPTQVKQAEQLLVLLGALEPTAGSDPSSCGDSSEAYRITEVGRKMLRLPMHPRFSRMLVEAQERNCVPMAALCAALVSGRDLLRRTGREEGHIREARELFETSERSDFITLIRAFQFARKNQFNPGACQRYGVNHVVAREVEQVFQQFLSLAQGEPSKEDPAAPPGVDEMNLLACIHRGFIDQLCQRRSPGTLECTMTGGRTGSLMRESMVQKANLIVAANIREITSRSGERMTLIGLATAITPEEIERSFPHLLKKQLLHIFDRTHRRVVPVEQLMLHDLPLRSSVAKTSDPAKCGEILARAYLDGHFELPLLTHKAKQWIARVNLVAAVYPEMNFPNFGGEGLFRCLAQAFSGLTLAKEAQAVALEPATRNWLSPEQQEWVELVAPTELVWAEGRKWKLQYRPDADTPATPPELTIKILDCWKEEEHPAICDGKIAVRLILQGPDQKKVAETSDWPKFKKQEFPKIKPLLQKRYPGSF
jgi:ATP-dependent helicase HrpB